MKKKLSVLPVLMLAILLALTACSGNPTGTETTTPASTPETATAPATAPSESSTSAASDSKTSAPVAEEIKGATIPEFSVLVNGIEVTQIKMAEYPIYSVQATSVNSSGTESTRTYIGFTIKDILTAAGLTDNYIWLKASASDGYAVTFTADIINEDTTLLAMTRDGSAFSNGPWFAPCSDGTSGSYLQDTASILVNITEGEPDIDVNVSDKNNGDIAAPVGLPEILDRTDKVEFTPYSFLVNGIEVTNETLEGLSIYKISATTVNSAGESAISDYTGYKLADVLVACELADVISVKAIAGDGYETELAGELIDSEYTLVAIEKDKELGADGTIWLAPCSETSSKSFCKLVVEIRAE